VLAYLVTMKIIRIRYIVNLILLISISAIAQPIRPLEKYQFDSSYKIVGLPTPFESPYKKLAFVLDQLPDMEALKNSIVLEKYASKYFELSHYTIYIIKSGMIVDQLVVNPSNDNMAISGQFYQFDASILRDVAKKHPLMFKVKEPSFNSRREYESYLEAMQDDKNYLFIFRPNTRYEGSFEVVVPKFDSVQNPMKASELLYKDFAAQKIGPVYITYRLNEENKKRTGQMVMHVDADRKVYDLYKPDPALTRRKYIPYEIRATVIFRK